MEFRVTCNNKGGNISCRKYGRSPKYQDCDGCYFLYTKRGEHWTEDVVRCECPIDLQEGEQALVTKVYKVEKL